MEIKAITRLNPTNDSNAVRSRARPVVRFAAMNSNSNNNTNRSSMVHFFTNRFKVQNKNTNSIFNRIVTSITKPIAYTVGNLLIKPMSKVVSVIADYLTHPKAIGGLAKEGLNQLSDALGFGRPFDSIPIDSEVGLSSAFEKAVEDNPLTKAATTGVTSWLGEKLDKFISIEKGKQLQDKTIALLEEIPIGRKAKTEIARSLNEHRDAIVQVMNLPDSKVNRLYKERVVNLETAKTFQKTLQTLKSEHSEEFNKAEVQSYLKLVDNWVKVLEGMLPYEKMAKVPEPVLTLMADNIITMLQDRNEQIRNAGFSIGKEAGLTVAQMNQAKRCK